MTSRSPRRSWRSNAIVFDTTDAASLEEARVQIPHHLDTIVNVPGHHGWGGADPRTSTLAERAAAWRTALDATMLSAVLTVQTLGDQLRSGGSIINVVADNPTDGGPEAADQGGAVQLDCRTSDPLRGQGHHDERRGLRTWYRAGLRRDRRDRRRRWPPRSPSWRCSSPPPLPAHITGQTLHVSHGSLAGFA